MLACYLTWHLRRAWAPLTYTDDDPPAADNPVTPARRSAAAQAKASRQHDPAGRPYRSPDGLSSSYLTRTSSAGSGQVAAVARDRPRPRTARGWPRIASPATRALIG